MNTPQKRFFSYLCKTKRVHDDTLRQIDLSPCLGVDLWGLGSYLFADSLRNIHAMFA